MAKREQAWKAMTTFPTEQKFKSSRARDGIWRGKVTRSHRESRVTDRELHRKLGEPSQDCFGNYLGDRRTLAIALVDKAMMALTPEKRAQVSPAQKWAAVDRILTSRRTCA